MTNEQLAAQVVKLAKALTSKKMNVEVKLDGSAETVKRIDVPSDIAKDTVKRNQFAREYFQELGYKKVEVGRWASTRNAADPKEVLKELKTIEVTYAEGPVNGGIGELKGKKFKSVADLQKALAKYPKPDMGYNKTGILITLNDGSQLTKFRYDHGGRDPNLTEQLNYYLKNNVTKKNKMDKTAVARGLVKMAKELIAGSVNAGRLVASADGSDWNKVNADFANETEKFAKKLEAFWKYLEATEKSMKAFVAQSNSGDVKADYENLVSRTKDRRGEVDELLFILNRTKNLKLFPKYY